MNKNRPYTEMHYHIIYSILLNFASVGKTTTYKSLAPHIGLPERGNVVGVVLGQILDRISLDTLATDDILLSALCVRASGEGEGFPGPGFYRLAENNGVFNPEQETLVEFWEKSRDLCWSYGQTQLIDR